MVSTLLAFAIVLATYVIVATVVIPFVLGLFDRRHRAADSYRGTPVDWPSPRRLRPPIERLPRR